MTMRILAAAALAAALAVPARAAAVGQPAPDFSLADTQGKTRSLKDFKGRWLVLEWTNHECPFVRKHYDTGNMQRLQKEYTAKKVAWLTIVSSRPNAEGYVTADQANRIAKEEKWAATATLLDPKGQAGRAYGAKATPHMFVIDPKGMLAYAGAIDDKRSADKADVTTARNFVRAALDAGMAGKPIETTATAAYGCSVKY